MFIAILTSKQTLSFPWSKKKTMVSHDTPSNPNSSILHHFLIPSDSISTQSHFETHNFNPYESVLRPNSTYPESVAVFPTIHSLGERISRSVNLESEMGQNRHVFQAPADLSTHPHRLSLSLNSKGIAPPLHYKHNYLVSGDEQDCSSHGIGYMVGGEFPFMGSSASYSRFLRPTQMLLEEVASVGGTAVDLTDLKGLLVGGCRGPTSAELKTELLSLSSCSSADKHQLQITISKLISLLEQVESRYEEYCNRMEELVSSFEVIAGEGAAKTYTSLALQAMCRHFCSLRQAILVQIKAGRKKLCPDLPRIRTGLSHLSLFDRVTSKSRMSLQQIGLMQQCQRQAWRPIRGLPETSVATLRAWLFEHFLHPYPNDSEKLILASQTGLTKNQVSNWFINARVRLWKPMIEEMYKEEFGESSSPGDSDPFLPSSGTSTRDPAADDQ